MKFFLTLILFTIAFINGTKAQQPGPGCEFRGYSDSNIQYRIYQKTAEKQYLYQPTYVASEYSVLPVTADCYAWNITGKRGSCYITVGRNYFEGYAGVMSKVECPLDDYLPLLMIGISPVALFLIRKKIAKAGIQAG